MHIFTESFFCSDGSDSWEIYIKYMIVFDHQVFYDFNAVAAVAGFDDVFVDILRFCLFICVDAN